MGKLFQMDPEDVLRHAEEIVSRPTASREDLLAHIQKQGLLLIFLEAQNEQLRNCLDGLIGLIGDSKRTAGYTAPGSDPADGPGKQGPG